MDERHYRRLSELKRIVARALAHDLYILDQQLQDLQSGNLLPHDVLPEDLRGLLAAITSEFRDLDRRRAEGKPDGAATQASEERIRSTMQRLAELLESDAAAEG